MWALALVVEGAYLLMWVMLRTGLGTLVVRRSGPSMMVCPSFLGFTMHTSDKEERSEPSPGHLLQATTGFGSPEAAQVSFRFSLSWGS